MSLLRSCSIALRNVLSRFYPLFSCCASCGEIKEPLERRLCTSLSPHFPVDAVFLEPCDAGAAAALEAEARARMPWLAHIFFIPPEAATDKSGPINGSAGQAAGSIDLHELRSAPPGCETDAAPPLEALLHKLTGLSDYYLVFTSSGLPESPAHILDWYTPNGIQLIAEPFLAAETPALFYADEPLVALRDISLPEGKTIRFYPQSKDASSAFLPFFLDFLRRTGRQGSQGCYRALLQQWLFLTGRGILSPGAKT